MQVKEFGVINGKKVHLYTLQNDYIKVEIITFGGAIRSIVVPDKAGNLVDVALGYDTVKEYDENSGYIGALIGRVGNRIGKGEFTLHGVDYKVGLNDNGNSLHGGINGFNKKVWDAKVDGENLILSTFAEDGEEGFPGKMEITVVYSLTEKGLKIDYTATADKDTPINLTNHAYFNLSGQGTGDILDTVMQINADFVTPVDEELITHGEFLKVQGTPFDFNEPKVVGKDIEDKHIQIKYCGGYDINFVLKGEGYRKVTVAKSEKTGIEMSVYTDQPGIQFYSGNFLSGVNGKGGAVYYKRNGFCLETQNHPNAINCKEYPNSVLKKGEVYHTITEYIFSK